MNIPHPHLEAMRRGATMEEVARLKDPAANTPQEARRNLEEGNVRFFNGAPQNSVVSANERRSQIMAQTPFAVVLGCADSRVPVELIFDVGPGDIFGIRVAGHVVDSATLGSVEYAVRQLKVHLVVVLGHEGCGAVAAAMLSPEEQAEHPENVRFLLDRITPSVRDLPQIRDPKARMREAVTRHVAHQVVLLKENPVVSEAIARGQIEVAGAFYEIGSGAVDFLEG